MDEKTPDRTPYGERVERIVGQAFAPFTNAEDEERVIIGNRVFGLNDYPEAYVDLLRDMLLDPVDEIERHDIEPESCPQDVTRSWRKSACFINGRAKIGRRLGIAHTFALGDWGCAGYFAQGYRDDETFIEDEDIAERLDWVTATKARDHFIWWYRRDTGDGILLPNYQYMIAFTDPADDAEFIAAFPTAVA